MQAVPDNNIAYPTAAQNDVLKSDVSSSDDEELVANCSTAKHRDKEWAALTTWLRMNLHHVSRVGCMQWTAFTSLSALPCVPATCICIAYLSCTHTAGYSFMPIDSTILKIDVTCGISIITWTQCC